MGFVESCWIRCRLQIVAVSCFDGVGSGQKKSFVSNTNLDHNSLVMPANVQVGFQCKACVHQVPHQSVVMCWASKYCRVPTTLGAVSMHGVQAIKLSIPRRRGMSLASSVCGSALGGQSIFQRCLPAVCQLSFFSPESQTCCSN
jgi:hypothetical protein